MKTGTGLRPASATGASRHPILAGTSCRRFAPIDFVAIILVLGRLRRREAVHPSGVQLNPLSIPE